VIYIEHCDKCGRQLPVPRPRSVGRNVLCSSCDPRVYVTKCDNCKGSHRSLEPEHCLMPILFGILVEYQDLPDASVAPLWGRLDWMKLAVDLKPILDKLAKGEYSA
jgi:hypothetical protein